VWVNGITWQYCHCRRNWTWRLLRWPSDYVPRFSISFREPIVRKLWEGVIEVPFKRQEALGCGENDGQVVDLIRWSIPLRDVNSSRRSRIKDAVEDYVPSSLYWMQSCWSWSQWMWLRQNKIRSWCEELAMSSWSVLIQRSSAGQKGSTMLESSIQSYNQHGRPLDWTTRYREDRDG